MQNPAVRCAPLLAATCTLYTPRLPPPCAAAMTRAALHPLVLMPSTHTYLNNSVDVRDVRESVVLLLLSERCTGAGAANMTVPCPAPPYA
jgi:hypothetical protein